MRNTGGLGAVTTDNGILVVDATDGTTAVDAFYLEQPAEAGPYSYSLYRGSIDDSGLENWYLRSKKRDDPIPDYRPEVSLYSSVYSNLMNYSRTLLGTFHQRVGAEEQVHDPRAQNKNTAYMNGGWLRVINRGGNIHDRGILAHGPNFNYQLYAVQAGVDVYHYEYDKGQRDFGGFYLTGGGGYSSVRHYTHTKAGNANFDSYGFGLYWTHIGSNDWYVDGVFQGSYFEPNVYSQYQTLNPMHNQSYAISLEAGYPFHLWNNWSVEPEGQLVYQNLPGTRSFDAASGVRFDTSNSFITRLGTRLVWDKFSAAEKEARGKTTLWVTPSFSYESQGVSRTKFSSEDGWIPFTSSLKGTWFSGDVGGTVQINPVVSLYGTVVGETYLNGRGQAYDVMAGLRFNL